VKRTRPGRRGQQGVTMLVALIMLVMLTLLAVSSFRVSNTNLKVVASAQGQGEATNAAQAAIDQVISSGNFAADPTTVAATPIPVDINNSGTPQYSVNLSPIPKCLKSRPTDVSTLDIANPLDQGCFGSAKIGQPATSVCYESVWEVTATTTDPVTQANVTVRQGVSLRQSQTQVLNACS
jgi:type II secretory pathway pseudopilin PulG